MFTWSIMLIFVFDWLFLFNQSKTKSANASSIILFVCLKKTRNISKIRFGTLTRECLFGASWLHTSNILFHIICLLYVRETEKKKHSSLLLKMHLRPIFFFCYDALHVNYTAHARRLQYSSVPFLCSICVLSAFENALTI